MSDATRERIARALAGQTWERFTGKAGMDRDRYIEEHWDKWLGHADAALSEIRNESGQRLL